MSKKKELEVKFMIPVFDGSLGDDEKAQILQELESTKIRQILSDNLGGSAAGRPWEFKMEAVHQSQK